jgi:hypothetical protein
MATDPSFLLGEYGARLDNLEMSVGRIDKNVQFLVQRETIRDTKEQSTRVMLTKVAAAVAAVVAFLVGVVQKMVVQ